MNRLVKSLRTVGLPSFLQELNSVAIALLERNGEVAIANRGFLYLAQQQTPPDDSWNAGALFLNPRFEEIAAISPPKEDGLLYRGILNMGDTDSICRSLRSSVYSWQGRLLVVAEQDIAALEQLSATVLELNEELAETQRELVRANRELRRNEAIIRQLMHTDSLTGVLNRRRLDESLAAEIQRSQRYGQSLCLTMADIDYFKRVNDSYGHAAGDEVLKHFAQVLREHSRNSDLVARYGGEEFVLLLPETSLKDAAALAERMRTTISGLIIPPLDYPVTASFGVAMRHPNETAESLLKRADSALYRAKHKGRNQVVLAGAAEQVLD